MPGINHPLELWLKTNLEELYGGATTREEYQPILDKINDGLPKACCAKPLKEGDIAWKCSDCEIDSTAVQCAECFELSDHKGHRIFLKKNVYGCCDCGDPEAWKSEGNCSKHRGLRNLEPAEIIAKLPEDLVRSARKVFRNIMIELKFKFMILENSAEVCLKTQLSQMQFNNVEKDCIRLIFEFLQARIEESSAFIHIIGLEFNQIYLMPGKFEKNEVHNDCCLHVFLPEDEEDRQEFEEVFMTHSDYPKLCSCTCLESCLQTNKYLDEQTKSLIYRFLINMFQSYHFKKCLALSYSANFGVIQDKNSSYNEDINHIGVQVYTGRDLSNLAYTHTELRNHMIDVYTRHLMRFSESHFEKLTVQNLRNVLQDLRYLAQNPNKTMISLILAQLPHLYFLDVKLPRTEMVAFMHEGRFDENIINICILVTEILSKHMTDLNFQQDKEEIIIIFKTFSQVFREIQHKYKSLAPQEFGFINLPAHRSFAEFFCRLYQTFLQDSENDGSESQVQGRFRKYLGQYLPQKELLVLIGTVMLLNVKHMAFMHEIMVRKWVYHGQMLELYPRAIYFPNFPLIVVPDLALMQLLLCFQEEWVLQGDELKLGHSQSMVELTATNFGIDQQLQVLIHGLASGKLIERDFGRFPIFDREKLRYQFVLFLKLFVQACVNETPVFFLMRTADMTPKLKEMKHEVTTRHAIQVLLVNKEYVSFETVKKDHVSVEDVIFEVSEQRRDQRGLVTFKLKEEFVKQFDPFYYLNPEQSSLIYQMFQMNYNKRDDVNDVVGDFQDYASHQLHIGQQIALNMTRCDLLVELVFSVMRVWLSKQAKSKEVQKDQEMRDEQAKGGQKISQVGIYTRLQFQIESQRVGSFVYWISLLQRHVQESIEAQNEKKRLEAQQFSPELAESLVDQNTFNHCLKILILMVKSLIKAPETKFLVRQVERSRFVERAKSTISLLEDFRQDTNCEIKMKEAIRFVLEMLMKLDGKYEDVEMKDELSLAVQAKDTQQKDQKKTKAKETQKKKQDKLMQKMKNKGKKLLENQTKPKEESLSQDKHEETIEEQTCAFCQEELKDFENNTFGRFMHVQETPLLYTSLKQTIKAQINFYKNMDLCDENQEEKKEGEGFTMFSADIEFMIHQDFKGQEDPLQSFWPNHPKALLNPKKDLPLICQDQQYLNRVTGSGAVITTCNHFGHNKCLHKYQGEQEIEQYAIHQKQLTGFLTGEFQCPLCKTMKNGIMPTISNFSSGEYQIQHQRIIFLIDFLSTVLMKQQGFIEEESKQTLQYFLKSSILMSDIKADPFLFIKMLSNFFIHQIMMIDVTGPRKAYDRKVVEQLFIVQQSAKQVLDFVMSQEVKEDMTLSSICKALQSDSLFAFKELDPLPLFAKNIASQTIFSLIITSIQHSNDGDQMQEAIQKIIQAFYNLIKFQALAVLQFQDNNGVLIGSREQVKDKLSLKSLIELQTRVGQQTDLHEKMVDILLPSLRKLFFTVYSLSLSRPVDQRISEQALKDVCVCAQLNEEEFNHIIKNLQLEEFEQKVKEQPDNATHRSFFKLCIDPVFIEAQLDALAVWLTDVQEVQEKPLKVLMPSAFLLLTPNFTFSLVELPKSYTDLQVTYYKKGCEYCKQINLKQSAICLLCGQQMCFMPGCIERSVIGKATLSFHTKLEGGQCIFLVPDTGAFIAVGNNGASSSFDTPYRTKYGEIISASNHLNTRDFEIGAEGGGEQSLKAMEELFTSHKLPNAILQQRTNPDSKYRVYVRDAI